VIEVKTCNDKPAMTPVDTRRYDLRALVDQVTLENSHELIDWGKPVGKENIERRELIVGKEP
jgi:antitoxin component of MazEF toxin-antitoxin module